MKYHTEDLIGRKFGRLTIYHDMGHNKKTRNRHLICKCECGNETESYLRDLLSGRSKSCGCLHAEQSRDAATKHGQCHHPLYGAWVAMRRRCRDSGFRSFKNYGGRGIAVCPEWENFEIFLSWANSSGWEEGLTIERVDNEGHYSPNNCRWATRAEQSRNTRQNRRLEFRGDILCVTDIARLANIDRSTLDRRLKLGIPLELAVIR